MAKSNILSTVMVFALITMSSSTSYSASYAEKKAACIEQFCSEERDTCRDTEGCTDVLVCFIAKMKYQNKSMKEAVNRCVTPKTDRDAAYAASDALSCGMAQCDILH